MTDRPPQLPDTVSDVMDSPTPAPASPDLGQAFVLIDTIRRDYEDAQREHEAKVEQLHREHAEAMERAYRENQQLAGQVGFLQAKLQSAEEQIRLLSAPKDEPEPAREPEPVKRSWWRRVLGG